MKKIWLAPAFLLVACAGWAVESAPACDKSVSACCAAKKEVAAECAKTAEKTSVDSSAPATQPLAWGLVDAKGNAVKPTPELIAALQAFLAEKTNSTVALMPLEAKTSEGTTTNGAATTPSTAPVAGGLIVAVDAEGNLVQPTQEQLDALKPKGGPRAATAPRQEAVKSADGKFSGTALVNPPQSFTAARINADGKLETGCFDSEAAAEAFKNGDTTKTGQTAAEGAKQ